MYAFPSICRFLNLEQRKKILLAASMFFQDRRYVSRRMFVAAARQYARRLISPISGLNTSRSLVSFRETHFQNLPSPPRWETDCRARCSLKYAEIRLISTTSQRLADNYKFRDSCVAFCFSALLPLLFFISSLKPGSEIGTARNLGVIIARRRRLVALAVSILKAGLKRKARGNFPAHDWFPRLATRLVRECRLVEPRCSLSLRSNTDANARWLFVGCMA